MDYYGCRTNRLTIRSESYNLDRFKIVGLAMGIETIKSLRTEFGLAIALSGLALGIVICALYLISHAFYFLVFGPTLIIGSVLFLLIRKRKINSLPTPGNQKVWIISNCIFFVLYCSSWWILFFHSSRSLQYFFIIALSVAITGVSIIASTGKYHTLLEIIKIFLISLNIKYSIYIFAGGIPGVDSWTHARMNDLLSQSGSITTLVGKEEFFPLMHIYVAITQLITNTSIKVATNFSVILPFIILSIFVFLIARHLFGDKVGLISLLVFNIMDYHTYWGANPQTTTFGFSLYCVVIFLLFKQMWEKWDKIWLILTIVLFMTLIQTHAVSSFVLFITLLGYMLGSWFINFESKTELYKNTICIVILYCIALIGYWGYFVQFVEDRSIFEQVGSNFIQHLQSSFSPIEGASETGKYIVLNPPPFLEHYLDNVAIIIILSLAIVTCLWWLSHHLYFPTTIIASIILSLTFVTFSFPLVGLRNIIPGRWFVFIYFFTSIAIGFYLVCICPCNKSKYAFQLTIVFVLFLLSFASITDSIANSDAPLWLKENTVATVYTPAEFMSSETLSKFNQTLLADSRFASAFSFHAQETKNLQFRISSTGQYCGINEDFLREEIFVWRSYMLTRPVQVLIYSYNDGNWYQDSYVAGLTTLSALERTNKIYDIKEVSGYIR